MNPNVPFVREPNTASKNPAARSWGPLENDNVPRLRTEPDRGYTRVSLVMLARWSFLSFSFVCFALSAWLWLDQRLHQDAAERLFTEATQSESPTPAIPAPAPKAPDATAPVVAKLEIARLGVSGFVEVGFGPSTLRRAIGMSPYG